MTSTQTHHKCPAWCTSHPALEPDGTHAASHWTGLGLEMSLFVHPEYGASVGVDHGPSDDLTLTEAQAHELGLALVRAADQLRRGRTEAQR